MFFVSARLKACLFVASATLLLLPTAQAADALSLSEALARALRDNPELHMYPYQRRAAEADRLQATLLPNPEVGVTLENFGGSGSVRGTRSLETTLTLSQLIELGGKRDRRLDAADAAIGDVAADYDVTRLDTLAETTRRYIDVVQAQAQIKVDEQAIALARQSGEAVERRIRAGAISTAERSRAHIALLRAQLDAQRTQGELDTKRVALAAMWGQGAPDFTTVSGDLYAIPPLMDFASFAGRVQSNPDIARFAVDRRLREAELKLAQAEAVPDLTVGVGFRRLNTGTDSGADYGLVASLNLPLPVFNRNQGKIAAARERLNQSDGARDAALLRTRAVLYGLYQSAAQARRQAEALRGEALSEAEQALILTQRGFANGRFSFLELADAQRQVLELRTQAISACADAQRIDTEIERLTAQPTVAGATGATP